MLPNDLVRRRVPHIAVAYGGVSLGFLYFIDYTVDTLILSPHWNRVALALVVLLIPSVLLLAYNHGAPGRDPWRTAEKIGIPLNVLAAVGILLNVFGGTDLGAATTSITVENEDGEQVRRVVAKPEFRKRTAIFTFDRAGGLNADDSWISYLVPHAIGLDLAQDDFIELVPDAFLQERIWSAGYSDLTGVPLSLKRQLSEDHHAEYLIAGDVGRADDELQINAGLYRVSTGRLLGEASFRDVDVLTSVDAVVRRLKDDMEIPRRDDIEDLPIRERLSSDPRAVEAFARGLEALLVRSDWRSATDHLSVATFADPTFAVAQHSLGATLLFSNRPQDAVAPMQRALDNAYRLPERLRFPIKADYYFTTQEFDRAWAVVEMWAELHPEDPVALENLLQVQRMRGEREGALETLGSLRRLNPGNGEILRRTAEAHEAMGRYDEALVALQEHAERFPGDHRSFVSLASHYVLRGDLARARGYLERSLLLEPSRPSLILAMADLQASAGEFDAAGAGLERALSMATSSQEAAEAWAALQRHHEARGELNAAAEAILNRLSAASAYEPPFRLVLQPADVRVFFSAGRGEEAIDNFLAEGSQLEPPFDSFARLSEAEIALHQNDFDRAHSLLDTAEGELSRLGIAEGFQDGMARARGRLAEREGDWEAALAAYGIRVALNYRSAMTRAAVHTDMGRALHAMGRNEEAEEETREALRLWPSSALAHLQLAQLLLERGDSGQTVGHLERALEAWANADPGYRPAEEARGMLGRLSR